MIRSIQFRHFKSLDDGELRLGPVTILIGPNASGKSNVIGAFRFLSEAISADVETAVARLGGIEDSVFWQASGGTFSLQVDYFVPDPSAPNSRADMRYHVEVGSYDGRAAVLKEELRLKSNRSEPGRPRIWLQSMRGKGFAVRDPASDKTESFDTSDPGVLALKAVGFLSTYPRVQALREFIEGWQFLSVNLDGIRQPHRDGRADRLSADASNLANVLRTLEQANSDTLEKIASDATWILKQLEGVSTEVDRGKLLLMVKERAFAQEFDALSASDGTLRLLALLTALHTMPPHALLCVEEPEHGLHPSVFGPLFDIIRERCPARGGRQVLVTTHSPDLLDAAKPPEVVVADRDRAGRTQMARPDHEGLARWLEDFRLSELWRMRQIGGVPD